MSRAVKLYLILSLSLVAVLIIVFYNLIDLKKFYLVAFHKSGVIGHFNSNGQIVGGFDVYINGKVVQNATVKYGIFDSWNVDRYPNGNVKTISFYNDGELDGIEFNYYNDGKIKREEAFNDGDREGPDTWYYENGQIERSLTYKNNKAEGLEHAYYKDGNLNYTRNWVDDRPYGDLYFYDDNANKKILFYHAYDILGVKFYLNRYDESRTDGYVFSSNIYSKDKDSVIVLKDNNSYKSISDLYVTIANPESASAQILMFINNKRYRDFDLIDRNTVKAGNVFLKKGIYDIIINGRFVNKPDDITTLKMKVIKQ
jgi:antitoxin component YwqK of YwqJK toxin-antitoxin module